MMQKVEVQHAENGKAANGQQIGDNDLESFNRHENGGILATGPPMLTGEHRQYLIQRHGTTNLDPIPDMTDRDPYNWPTRKKITNLVLVAFHAMMGTFTASAIQSAFAEIATDLDVSVQRASYLTSLVIAILGGAPLFWRPLCNRYGRRPIFLLSLLCSLVGNIGCANSPSYGTMGLSPAITAFFISPPAGIGSAVVAETFFKKDRAKCMGLWAVMISIGVPLAPFIFGFVVTRVGYRWIYYILAIVHSGGSGRMIINGEMLTFFRRMVFNLLHIGPETLYIRRDMPTREIGPSQNLFTFKRINPDPLMLRDFIQPLALSIRPCVLLPAVAHSMVFLLASILISIEIPQLFPEMFGLNAEQVGLQYVALIIGSVIGEQIGGYTSDRWMRLREKKTKQPVTPEYRLWLNYPGFILSIVGLLVFLVQVQNASSHWNVSPLIGAAIAWAGNQIVMTVNITYAVDCYRSEAASFGVLITFVRQIWGFIGPFWFPQMLENVGFLGSTGIIIALIVAFSVIPTTVLQWKGRNWR